MGLGVLGAVDANLTSAITAVETYFSENLFTVVMAFVTIACALWLLAILFHSAGVKKPTRFE